MIGKGATPSFFAIANDNYTLTTRNIPNKKAQPCAAFQTSDTKSNFGHAKGYALFTYQFILPNISHRFLQAWSLIHQAPPLGLYEAYP